MPGGEPLAVRNATRQDVRYPPRRCPSGPSPQRGAQGPHERHPGHPQLRRCAPRPSAARVEGIFLARCRSSGGRRAARRGDGASPRAPRVSPSPRFDPYSRASETRPAPSVPAAHPRSPRRPLPPVTQRIPTRPPRWPTPGSTPPTPRIGRRSTCVSPTPTIAASRILPRRAPHPRASSPVFDPPGASP